MLPLSIAHLEELATVFEASLAGEVSSSACWGTLYLVIKVRRGSPLLPVMVHVSDLLVDIKHVANGIPPCLSYVEGLGSKGRAFEWIQQKVSGC